MDLECWLRDAIAGIYIRPVIRRPSTAALPREPPVPPAAARGFGIAAVSLGPTRTVHHELHGQGNRASGGGQLAAAGRRDRRRNASISCELQDAKSCMLIHASPGGHAVRRSGTDAAHAASASERTCMGLFMLACTSVCTGLLHMQQSAKAARPTTLRTA